MRKYFGLKAGLLIGACIITQLGIGFATWVTVASANDRTDNFSASVQNIIDIADGISVQIDTSKLKMGKYTYNYDGSAQNIGILTYKIVVIPSDLPSDLKIENSAKTGYVFNLKSVISTLKKDACFSTSYIAGTDYYTIVNKEKNTLSFNSSSYASDNKSMSLSYTINTTSKTSIEEDFCIDIKFNEDLIINFKSSLLSSGNHFNFSLDQGVN